MLKNRGARCVFGLQGCFQRCVQAQGGADRAPEAPQFNSAPFKLAVHGPEHPLRLPPAANRCSTAVQPQPWPVEGARQATPARGGRARLLRPPPALLRRPPSPLSMQLLFNGVPPNRGRACSAVACGLQQRWVSYSPWSQCCSRGMHASACRGAALGGTSSMHAGVHIMLATVAQLQRCRIRRRVCKPRRRQHRC